MGSSSAVVVIPTLNEAENLKRLLPALLKLPVDILIVDDASTDGTQEVIGFHSENSGRVELLARARKMGLGSAYRDGFSIVLHAGYSTVVQMDADGSHRVEDLEKLLDRFARDPKLELIIGSRWINGGSVVNWPFHRELLSRGANLYARELLGLRVRDITAGFRIYSSALLKRMNLASITSEGYAFQIEMTREATRVGANIEELPIQFVEREFGVSKMSWRIVREALAKVTKWGITRLVGR